MEETKIYIIAVVIIFLSLLFFKFLDDYFQIKKELKRVKKQNKEMRNYIFRQK